MILICLKEKHMTQEGTIVQITNLQYKAILSLKRYDNI